MPPRRRKGAPQEPEADAGDDSKTTSCGPCVLLSLFVGALLCTTCGYALTQMHTEWSPHHEASSATAAVEEAQRCPPANDRYHAHCIEGRKHVILSIDWSCLGVRRGESARLAFMSFTPIAGGSSGEEAPLRGISEVPTWLSDVNADALHGEACVSAIRHDRKCDECRPTRPSGNEGDAEFRRARERILVARLSGAAGPQAQQPDHSEINSHTLTQMRSAAKLWKENHINDVYAKLKEKKNATGAAAAEDHVAHTFDVGAENVVHEVLPVPRKAVEEQSEGYQPPTAED
jgi:hypothetical protein